MAKALAAAAAEAEALAEQGSERELAELRSRWADEIEGEARSSDYRRRAVAYRAVGQFRFRQKLELLRRGLEDESPACRGSALVSLERLSRQGPSPVNDVPTAGHDRDPREPRPGRPGRPRAGRRSGADRSSSEEEGRAPLAAAAAAVRALAAAPRAEAPPAPPVQ